MVDNQSRIDFESYDSDSHDDGSGIVENDGRSKTNTGFDPRDSDESTTVERDGGFHDYWEWLNQLNDGRTEGRWTHGSDRNERVRRANDKRDIRTFASQLELTDFQIERACHALDNLDSLEFGSIRRETIVLALISLVANEDGRAIRRCGPYTTVDNGSERKEVPLFTKMMYDVRSSPQSIRKARKILRGRDVL